MSQGKSLGVSKQNSRLITKTRIIAGLLAEIDASETLIVIKNANDETFQHVTLKCDIQIPFETSKITLIGGSRTPGTYSASALFAGQRVTFDIVVHDAIGNCTFPSQLLLSDLRRSKRQAFGPDIQIAEISSKNGITFATPIDLSQNSLAVVSAVQNPILKKGEQVNVRIRGLTSSRDVFGLNMCVADVDRSISVTRILLSMTVPLRSKLSFKNRHFERVPPLETSISISPLDTHIGETLLCEVIDVSISGLKASIKVKNQANWVAPGLHVRLQDSDVHATVIWRDGSDFGLRLDALDDSKTLSCWYDLLKRLTQTTGVHHSHIDELVNLFTESGLLKGSRRKVYGIKPGKFMPPEAVTNNPLLYHRIASKIDDGKIVGQVSMVRLTDEYWFMQEGAHNGDSRAVTYDRLLDNVLVVAKHLSKSSILAPRYVGALVHSTVKSSADLMHKLCSGDQNRILDSLHISLRNHKNLNFEETQNQQILELRSASAETRRNLSLAFDPILFDVFYGTNGTHPRLNSELSRLGPNHQARTVALSEKGSFWGLAYRLNSYYSLSSTGVINSLFLIVGPGACAKTIKTGLAKLSEIGMTNGTDDVVLIFDRSWTARGGASKNNFSEILTEIDSGKPFTLYVFDTLRAS